MATGTSKTPILIMPTTLPGPPAIPTVLTSPSAAAAGPGGYNNFLVYFYLTVKFTPYLWAIGWQVVLFSGESQHFLSGDTKENITPLTPEGVGGGLLGQFLLGVCHWPLRTPTPLYCILWLVIDPHLSDFWANVIL